MSEFPVDRGSKGDSRQRRAFQKLSQETFGVTLVGGDGITVNTTTNTVSINLSAISGLEFSLGSLQVKVDVVSNNMLQMTAAGLKVLSPLTTKGDIFIYSTGNDRLGVGADGSVLVADSAQAKGLRWAAVLVPTVTVHTFSALLDSNNIATANVDDGVQFILKAGDRPLRIKKISLASTVRPNTGAASPSTITHVFLMTRGQGLMSVPEAANTQVPVLPQCLDNRRVASSAILVRRAIADMFSPSGLTMYPQDVRGCLGLVPEPTGGGTKSRGLHVEMGLLEADDPDDYVMIVQPGEALIIRVKALFGLGSSMNMNGYVVWEEDETTLSTV